MFITGNDAVTREVFAEYVPENAKVFGVALREKKKLIDKLTKGVRSGASCGVKAVDSLYHLLIQTLRIHE